MVMEHCAGGEAFDYVCANGRLKDRGEDVRRIFRQIVEAVGYCHERNFVHRLVWGGWCGWASNERSERGHTWFRVAQVRANRRQ